MKKNPILWAMLVVLLAFSVVFMGCPAEDDGGGGGGAFNVDGTYNGTYGWYSNNTTNDEGYFDATIVVADKTITVTGTKTSSGDPVNLTLTIDGDLVFREDDSDDTVYMEGNIIEDEGQGNMKGYLRFAKGTWMIAGLIDRQVISFTVTIGGVYYSITLAPK